MFINQRKHCIFIKCNQKGDGRIIMYFNDKFFIAKKIRLARKQARLTQAELSEKIGISSKQLSRIETGDYIPSLPTFLKIISVLPIDIKDFGIENAPKTNPIREKLNKIFACATDKELVLFFKIAQAIVGQE